jgi:short-subunit dehydrogenase
MTRYRAIITGASGGLGAAFARALAPYAATLVLTGRRQPALESLGAELIAVHPHLDVRTLACELTDAADRQALADAASGAAAPIDLLINNAGINDFHAFESQADAMLERLVAVNLVAPMQLARHLLPLLRRAPRAQIINVGSIFGYIGYPGYTVYCATKFGLRGFSEALRRELADTSISVRYFAPRAVSTPLTTLAMAALNAAVGNQEDAPERVAQSLLRFLGRAGAEYRVGLPERLYVWINRMAPALNDRALRAQLPIIRRYLAPARPGGPSAKE